MVKIKSIYISKYNDVDPMKSNWIWISSMEKTVDDYEHKGSLLQFLVQYEMWRRKLCYSNSAPREYCLFFLITHPLF